MNTIIGRKEEQEILKMTLNSTEAELVAVYGRRRVGKTYLIRKTFEKHVIFEFSGVHNASLKEQLINFSTALDGYLQMPVPAAIPQNWSQAFQVLRNYAQPLLKKRKCVVFLDEFPWLSSNRSGFLPAFEYFWNSWGTKQDNLVLIICGSAASWMIKKVVRNKEGLHNRLTRKIRLLPFTLNETQQFLQSRNINLDHYQITEIFMAMGGIPQYLKEIQPGKSAAQNIDRICFTKDGGLLEEFKNLYQSLFDKADRHIDMVRALAGKPYGLTRKEIIIACKLPDGGSTTELIEELAESGFITAHAPFEKSVRDNIYKLSDEYSRFYLKFMDNTRAGGEGTWIKLSASPAWRSWSGTAFESVCLKHIKEIKKALGISGVYTEESAWRCVPGKDHLGAQVDLLIDRRDQCISICEMKFFTNEFTIEKSYAAELQRKLNVFKQKSKTLKTLFLVMVTTFGTRNNIYKIGLVQNEVTLKDLFI